MIHSYLSFHSQLKGHCLQEVLPDWPPFVNLDDPPHAAMTPLGPTSGPHRSYWMIPWHWCGCWTCPVDGDFLEGSVWGSTFLSPQCLAQSSTHLKNAQQAVMHRILHDKHHSSMKVVLIYPSDIYWSTAYGKSGLSIKHTWFHIKLTAILQEAYIYSHFTGK